MGNNDYEIMRRIWVRSDGEFIREWTIDEYIRHNPENKIILRIDVNGSSIEVLAHCIEDQRVFARNNQNNRVLEFNKCIEYK